MLPENTGIATDHHPSEHHEAQLTHLSLDNSFDIYLGNLHATILTGCRYRQSTHQLPPRTSRRVVDTYLSLSHVLIPASTEASVLSIPPIFPAEQTPLDTQISVFQIYYMSYLHKQAAMTFIIGGRMSVRE